VATVLIIFVGINLPNLVHFKDVKVFHYLLNDVTPYALNYTQKQ